MFIESLVLSAMVIIVVLLRRDKTLYMQMEFVFDKTRIPFCKTKYKNWAEFDFVQDQLINIALDKDKNSFFRHIGITAFSIQEISTEKEFFYVYLKTP